MFPLINKTNKNAVLSVYIAFQCSFVLRTKVSKLLIENHTKKCIQGKSNLRVIP